MVATNLSTKNPPILGIRFSSHLTLHFRASMKASEKRDAVEDITILPSWTIKHKA